ncbi:M56 family metallopeptidase [Phenylobacterium sp.]|uniref:M56 family metallopeptidase n=1 Tax=Phenylobacterium sp. TaxID=1871053 RepID=UPI00120BAB17|nr:M56 family metallopeptidase [Phenylobacterium sp.]THD55407.1 MAG: hypothetical protein E8A12_16145 [Phenylobacterium sp.]
MIAAILLGLLKANLAAAAAVVLGLALRKAVRGRLGARAAYALWLAPVLAAGAVLLPHPAAKVSEPPPIVAPMVLQAEAVTDEFVAAATQRSGPDIPALLLAAWIAGGLAAAGLLAWRQARFVAALGHLTPLAEPGLFRAERTGVGPAVVGVLKPKVVAPADFETRYSEGERTLILAHEAAHLRAHDALANAAACAAQCVCWFNPLAHVAARVMRVDQELACDAAVIGRFPGERRTYAELLLKTQLFTQPLPLGCHWPASAEHPLKERIAMLKFPLPAIAARRLGAAVALLACAGAAGLAWASQPAPGAPQAAPTAADLAAIPNNGHLEPEEARKLWRPGLSFLCKPGENRELHNCRMTLTPFETIATAADVQREWPAAAKKAGLTGMVTLQCTPNPATRRLEQCVGYHFEGAAERPELKVAFEQAAVRVISVIRLRANPSPDEAITRRGFYSIPFDNHPVLPGDPPTNPPTTRYPDFLPDRDGKTATPAKAKAAEAPALRMPASYAPAAAVTESADEDSLWNATPTVTTPIWTRKPTIEDIARLYPADAAKQGLSAQVVVTCRIGVDGRLAECGIGRDDVKVAGREPSLADQDFGTATLQLAKIFRMQPVSRDGQKTAGGVVRIPVRWMPPQPPQEP